VNSNPDDFAYDELTKYSTYRETVCELHGKKSRKIAFVQVAENEILNYFDGISVIQA
jgi:hypothetical protein